MYVWWEQNIEELGAASVAVVGLTPHFGVGVMREGLPWVRPYQCAERQVFQLVERSDLADTF